MRLKGGLGPGSEGGGGGGEGGDLRGDEESLMVVGGSFANLCLGMGASEERAYGVMRRDRGGRARWGGDPWCSDPAGQPPTWKNSN